MIDLIDKGIRSKKTTYINLNNALLNIRDKDMIIQKAFNFFRKKFPNYKVMGIYKQLSESTGFSIMTVRRMISNTKKLKHKYELKNKSNLLVNIVQKEHT